MGKIEKTAGSVSVIGGSDGPTSVFLVGKNKKTIKQRIQKRIFEMRKKLHSKRIKPGTHTMDEVICYTKEKYGFEEIAKDTREYLEQHDSLRTSFMMQYAPELLGEYANPPKLQKRDDEALKEFMKQFEIREQKAKEIPDDKFTIDFHILKKTEKESKMHLDLEARFGHIGGGFSGSDRRGTRQYSKIYKDVRRYYGVTEEDIVNKTKRYQELLTTLAMKH